MTIHRQRVSFSSTAILVLQWDDPYASVSGSPGAQHDIDIVAFDLSGTVAQSSLRLNFEGDPVEFFQIPSGTYDLEISLCPVPNVPPRDNVKMKYIITGSDAVIQFATDSSTSFGHPNQSFTAGVGAAFWQLTPQFGTNPPLLETFSSAGGTAIFFNEDGTRKDAPEIRQQPRFVGVDGTSTTFFGGGPLFRFFGELLDCLLSLPCGSSMGNSTSIFLRVATL